MGTPVTNRSLDLGAGVLTSPIRLGGLGLSSEGRRSSGPAIFGTFSHLWPLTKIREAQPKLQNLKVITLDPIGDGNPHVGCQEPQKTSALLCLATQSQNYSSWGKLGPFVQA